MRRYNILLFTGCLVLLNLPRFVPVFAQSWQELSGDHFIIYHSGNEDLAKDVLEKSEVYYNKIAADLGYTRYGGFWIWEKRVKIYLYPDRASFMKATGQPEWSEGMAGYKNKEIASFLGNKGFLESILPHEMAHLIFRDFVGFKGEIPLWLDEGVAQREEELKRKEIERVAKLRYKNNELLSINDMMRIDVRNIKDKDRIYIRPIKLKKDEQGILFLTGNNLITTYYIQSVSLVSFLIDRYGSDNFAFFCRQLRDGKGLEEALSFAYPTYMRNLGELEDKWREYLEKE
jgi:hypothetical protein